METVKIETSRTTAWRRQKELETELHELSEKYESLKRSEIAIRQRVQFLQDSETELKQAKAVLETELKQATAKLKQFETESLSRSGLLKRPGHILAVLAIFLLANVWHNASGYAQTGGSLIFGLFVVLSIDLAVLAFVRNGMKLQAALYAFGTFVVTFLSFNPDMFTAQNYVISAIFAGGFSYGIYSFSELFNQKN